MLEWISILLKAVDISSDKATSYLKEFVTPASHSVTSKYKKFIEKTVSLYAQSTVHVRVMCGLLTHNMVFLGYTVYH